MAEFTSRASTNESIFSEYEENFSSENVLNDINYINYEEIDKIFNNQSIPLEEDNEYDERFFIPDKKKPGRKNIPDKKKPGRKKKDLFKVTDSTNDITQLINEKREKASYSNKDKTKIHGRFSFDNLLTKTKNHSLSSLPPFFNDILKDLSIKGKFYQLSHKFKKNIKNNYFSELKKKTLGDIICNEISPKYKLDKNANIKTFNKVKDNEVLKKIFDMDYATFFKRYYMESKKCINLRDYGLENEIILSEKCKMYNDLIEKIKNSSNYDNEGYIKSIKKCIDKNYFTKKLFKTRK